MKLICNRYYIYELTYGRAYDILGDYGKSNLWIINDKGETTFYLKTLFVSLEEWREIQLNKLYEKN